MDEKRRARLQGLMGLCVRARQAVFGEDGCLKTIRAGNAGVLLVDSGASPATKDKYISAAAHFGVMLGWLPGDLLHEATGRPGVAMVVLQGGLAQQIQQLLKEIPDVVNNGGGAIA
ncbi:MAG: hypothetical protein E7333_04410 [Clostridiales bacterium]|nr:hypothetical protein [Clostridiales bacterium]